ncbi:MAG: sigma-70 family RNA polymerase sigma factor [Paramuribaculum sp.]|nr:sigma-70 family RNA polymerase sigma factor [Paramuribaculum sp.]MDE7450019.1 sigma-70 family RNA polymerase sigma factor [Paramuribaculum sp.]
MQNLTKLTDDRLVKAYADGNPQAFDILLKRHQSRIFSYIYSIVKNRDVADDIFQETFVKAIMTIRQGRYSESGKFSNWLTRIAHNLIIDFYRQEKSENLVSADNDEVDVLNRRDLCEDNIEDLMIDNQIREDVRRIIDALPENQREVLMMRYYQDMSFKEIAEATGVSINTALGRMRYAILNMRRIAEQNHIALTAS